MKIRRDMRAAIAVLGMLSLAGCAQGLDATAPATPQASVDPFVVDIQVPYATNQPTATPDASVEEDDSYISISADGRVTILKDSWDEYVYEDVDQAGYYAQLRLGDSGVEVRNMQNRLKELGYYSGEDTGEFDEATQAALMEFEGHYYEKCYGVATVKLQALLFSQSAISAVSASQPEADPDAAIDPDAVPGTEETPVPAPEQLVQLRLEDENDAVTRLQQRLQQLGYLYGSVTGRYDYYTCCAVMRFEAAYGRELTGIATTSMQEYLYREDAIAMNSGDDRAGAKGIFLEMSQGDTGADVVLLQQRLVNLGYSTNTPNGKFNKYTAELLKVFQQRGGLEATGVADTETLQLLYGSAAPRGEGE